MRRTAIILQLALLGCFMQTTAHAQSTPPPSSQKRVFGVVYNPSEHDPSVKRVLDSYLALVKSTYNWDSVYIQAGSRTSPATLRSQIKKAWVEDKIDGVFLVGRQPMIKISVARGLDKTLCPEYYTDLDARFEDQNQDGILDRYYPWENGDTKIHEVWLARLMPDGVTRHGLSPDGQLTSYFAKLSNFIRSGANRSGRTVITSSRDWQNRSGVASEMQKTFGKVPEAIAARISTTPPTTSEPKNESTPGKFWKALAIPSDFTYLSVHGEAHAWHCDEPLNGGNVVGTSFGRAFHNVDQFRINATVLVSMSCHYLGIDGRRDFIAASALLHPANRCFLTIGSARSIGMDNEPLMVRELRTGQPVDAWLRYYNEVSSESYMKRWLGSRNVWEQEKDAFVWAYYWYGAPFGPFEVGLGKGGSQ